MAEEKLLTVREVSLILGLSEKTIVELAENGGIPAYKVGGVFLRFKREQISEFKKKAPANLLKRDALQKYAFNSPLTEKTTFRDKVSDFFYFNDFYILTLVIIVLLLAIIFGGY